MIIKIRKETCGYTIFRQDDRKYFFVETSEDMKSSSKFSQQRFLGTYYKDFEAQKDEVRFVGEQEIKVSTPGLAAPIGMYLEITKKCNLNCGHCYKPEEINSSFMRLDQIEGLIDELANIGVMEIRLCGNEPTRSQDFISVAKHIQEKGLYLGINTNAVMSVETRERFLDLSPNLVVVSIDGDIETHDKIRGRGAYEKAVRLIEDFKARGVECRINTVLSKVTLDKIFGVVELANDLRCGVSFLPFRPIGKDKKFNAENAINSKQMRKVVEEIMQARKMFPDILLYTYFDVLVEGEPRYHHPIDKFNMPCPARKNGFITCSGDFFPCDFLRWAGEKFFCGNIFQEGGFKKLWKDSRTLQYFQNLKHEKCYRCNYYMKKCYGGCVCNAIASGGSSDDVLCFIDV
ncbi:radical SAM protein [Patescibacteria group bacterium]